MVFLIDYLYDELYKISTLGEHRIKDWIITKSVWNVIGIAAVYLIIVCVIGPAFMKRRKPYNLDKILIAYNIIQIFLNLFILYLSISIGWLWKYNFICEPTDYSTSPHGMRELNSVWIYFLLKLFDLFDTLFFVLRKKQNQVTFLHLYHHSGMILLVWCALKLVPGGHGTFLGLINGIVHIFMYSYYLLMSLKYRNIWWKKYITQLQILQFFLISLQCTLGLLKKDCSFPKITFILFLPHNFLMLFLFIKFYIKVYNNKTTSTINRNNVSKIRDDNNVESSSNKKIKTR